MVRRAGHVVQPEVYRKVSTRDQMALVCPSLSLGITICKMAWSKSDVSNYVAKMCYFTPQSRGTVGGVRLARAPLATTRGHKQLHPFRMCVLNKNSNFHVAMTQNSF